MSDTPKTEVEFLQGHMHRLLTRKAGQLRDLADDFDRIAREVGHVGMPGYPVTYSRVVGSALSAFATLHANTHFETITEYAAEADVAAALARASGADRA